MKQTLRFTVPGDPKGQPRSRAFARNGMVRVYDPGTAENWKSAIAIAFKEQCPTWKQFEGPVRLSWRAYFRRPKAHFNKKGLRPGSPEYHTSKPDRDNLDKAIMDALTHIGIWRDDSQACAGFLEKLYSEAPTTEILLSGEVEG